MSASELRFEEFYLVHASRLVRVAHVIVRDRHAAEDVVQTAFAKAFASWWRVRRADDPAAYVRRMVVNAALAHLRRAVYRFESPVGELPELFTEPGDEALLGRDAMWRLLGRLPARQRAVVVLRYYEDLSEREIADAMGCRPGTVKSQAAAAMKTLRRLLDATSTKEVR